MLSNKQIWVLGLMVACPEGIPRADCPLQKHRVGEGKDRLRDMKKLTPEKLDKFIKHHHECVYSRVCTV